MHSDLKKLLRFTSLQTKIMVTAIIGFLLIIVFFLFLYCRTEINSRLDQAGNEFDQRLLSLNYKIQNFENNVSRMKEMAALSLSETDFLTIPQNLSESLEFKDVNGHVRADLQSSSFSGKKFSGMLIGNSNLLTAKDSRAFKNEFAMAVNLLSLQYAMNHSGEPVTRSYYYSKTFDFFSIYPATPNDHIKNQPIPEFPAYSPKKGTGDKPFWTGPSMDSHLGRPILTSAIHLYSNNTLKGTIGMDISPDSLSGFTEPFFNGRGLAVLCSKTGQIISSSEGNNHSASNPVARNLSDLLPESEKQRANDLLTRTTQGFIYQNGYFSFGKDLNSAPFRLIYLISARDFLISMIPNMYVYIFSILTAIAMFILGIFIIITRFIKPTRIAEIALRKAHDELEIRVNERTTELIRMNNELKESREKYRQLFIHAPAGIYEIDFISGKFVSVNDVLCEYTGYSKEEFLNLSPFALLTPQGKEILKERLNTVLRGEKISRNVELEIINKDGSTFSAVLNNSFIIKDEKITGSRVVIHDISERKITERALKKSEERFRNLVESTSDWIWDLDNNGYFIYNSPSVEAITGYTAQEILGTRFINYFPIHEREKLYMILMRNIRPGEPLSTIECTIQHKNGECRTIETRGVHYYDDAGNVLGARGISRDITDKKRIELEKAELQKTLDRAKTMEALGLLAGGVAHDLNNILSGIINYPELILLDLPPDSCIRDHVKAIYSSGKKAAAIVDDLITVARGAARKNEILNINTIIGEYLHSAEYASMTALYPSVKVKVSMDKDLHNITTSSVQIKKALLNLVINAVESVQKNGEVCISSQNITLQDPIRGFDEIPPGEYVLLSVADTGGGISSEDMERIFEPFYSKKVMGRSGTGLGLSIVWNTVSEHNGHINVTSGNNGTVFDLYFPSTRFPVSEKKENARIESFKGQGQKVLVVDDETTQREIASQLLNTLRYSSVACESGEKAVEYLKREKVDLVLLDMIMEPGMNGRETYEKIIEIHPEQKVVITTGFADTSEVKTAQEQGAGELLKKPYTLEELGMVINRQLNS